jgi:Secretion system C-terminal sorting domain
VVPSGGTPVSGNVVSKVTIDAAVQSYLGSPYVQRHYDIEPATNAATATATVTLYYTQSEFDAYNLAAGINPPLPASPGDAVGIANLRVSQYHGTGTAPGNYTGSTELIDPVDANIVWNATLSRWEVTINVNGFSGFYTRTIGGVLPINLISFSGTSNGPLNKILWITAGEQNSAYFDLERSTDGITFSKAATIAAQSNNSSNKNYSYNDTKGVSDVYYYRLKMVDTDGSFKYSAIIRLNNKQRGVISLYPNPAKETVTVSISDTKLLHTDLRITDMNGSLVKTVYINNLQQPVDISRMNAGTYIIQLADGNVSKFIKQ